MLVMTRSQGLRSTATNAYELCEDAAQAILDEPKRYYQEDWLTFNEDTILCRLTRTFNRLPDLLKDPAPPACGTQFCRAGAIVLLAKGNNKSDIKFDVSERARELLGQPNPWSMYEESETAEDCAFRHSIDNMFSGEALMREAGVDEGNPPDELCYPGTRAYAEAGAAGIRAFMKKWEERLKATPVQVEPLPDEPEYNVYTGRHASED